MNMPHLMKRRGSLTELCFGSLYIVVEYVYGHVHRFCHCHIASVRDNKYTVLFLQACGSSKAVNDLLEVMLLLEAPSQSPMRFMIAVVLRCLQFRAAR